MSDPSPEHVEAVGALLDDKTLMRASRSLGVFASRHIAAALLNSTDPAVLAAFVDALVRAGVLSEETYAVDAMTDTTTTQPCVVTILCPHHAAVVASTIRAVPHLDPDERDRLADDLARQCQQCTHDPEDPE